MSSLDEPFEDRRGGGFASGPSNIWTLYEPSLLKRSERYVSMVLTLSGSWPSTAMTVPRVSWAGLVGPGGARAGEILERTLILLMKGIVSTIASMLFLFC